jgi:signal transduction histidine kinase
MKAKMASIMLLSEDGEHLTLAASAGASNAYAKKPDLPVSESLAGIVVRRKKPLASLDVRKDSRYQHTPLAKRDKLVSLLCVPLVFEKQVLGVLSIYTETLHRFSNEEIRLLTAMAGLSSVVIARVRMAERMSRMEENLKSSERLSALGWLAAEVAHEIRNPLAVLQMLFHALEKDLPAQASKDARLIQTKMMQMNRIVEQVLSFARSSEPALERIRIEQMMDDLLLLTRHKLAEQNVEIKRMVQPGLPPLHGDRMQLEQALLNLILNACHAMPTGGVLTLSAKKRKNEIVLGVKDTGAGISKRDKERLFQPLMTTKQGGSGIGLVLVRKTVEHHGGRLLCRSQKGRGTSFEICLQG